MSAETAGPNADEYERMVDRFNGRRALGFAGTEFPGPVSASFSQFVVEPIFGYVSRNDSFLGTKSGKSSTVVPVQRFSTPRASHDLLLSVLFHLTFSRPTRRLGFVIG